MVCECPRVSRGSSSDGLGPLLDTFPFSLVTIRVSDSILFEPSRPLSACTNMLQSTFESQEHAVENG